jgi:hypothetical protein
MKLKNFSDQQRLDLTRAYVRQLTQICNKKYGGDWDAMPHNVKVDWNKVHTVSKVKGLELKSGTVARIISKIPDSILEEACELENRG